jgi:hypothetical protein
MWAGIAKSLLDVLKLAPRYLIAVAVICALLLFAPQSLQDTLGTAKFVDSYRQWIGLAMICSLGIWIVVVTTDGLNWVKRLWGRKQRQKKIANRLGNLTEPEKQILRYYIAMNTRGNKLRTESGDVMALVHAEIIYRSAAVGSVLEGFAHNISDFAWDYIHSNPHVLDGTTNTYHTDQREDWR